MKINDYEVYLSTNSIGIGVILFKIYESGRITANCFVKHLPSRKIDKQSFKFENSLKYIEDNKKLLYIISKDFVNNFISISNYEDHIINKNILFPKKYEVAEAFKNIEAEQLFSLYWYHEDLMDQILTNIASNSDLYYILKYFKDTINMIKDNN